MRTRILGREEQKWKTRVVSVKTRLVSFYLRLTDLVYSETDLFFFSETNHVFYETDLVHKMRSRSGNKRLDGAPIYQG